MSDEAPTPKKSSPKALLQAIKQRYAAATNTVPRLLEHDRIRAVRAMRENVPFLLVNSGITVGSDLYSESPTISQLLSSLVQKFGPKCKVPVTVCGATSYNTDNSAEDTLESYCKYLEEACAGSLDNGEDAPRYLKDWHIALARPQAQISCPLYNTPWAFRDDWLNAWHDSIESKDDYRFLYAGPKGSWTPMHHDVLLSYSWSINIVGRKRWLLFPPACTPDLMQTGGTLVADLRPYVPLVGAPTLKPPTPALARALHKMIVVDQGVNEALFVPSGWHHQVQTFKLLS